MTLLTPKNRWPVFIAAAAGILLVMGLLSQSKDKLHEQAQRYWPFGEHHSDTHKQPGNELASTIDQPHVAVLPPTKQDSNSFFEIATKYGTDKVTDHSYQDMYEKYLPQIRFNKLKVLEIGLGCDMSYGPGASYYTWLEYLPNVDLYFLEYDAKCAEQWAHKTTQATIITGDQGDGPTLELLIGKYGNDFDIIIDDGGHTMDQQKTSLEHLWKAVKPGGMYFCEDLQTSYWPDYGGGATAVQNGQTTMMQYIHQMIEDLYVYMLSWVPAALSALSFTDTFSQDLG